jgi:hypothetical protein
MISSAIADLPRSVRLLLLSAVWAIHRKCLPDKGSMRAELAARRAEWLAGRAERPLMELLLDCLEHRFGNDVALGSPLPTPTRRRQQPLTAFSQFRGCFRWCGR